MNNSASDLQFLSKALKERELDLAHARKALEHEKEKQFYELQYKYVTSPYEADKSSGLSKEKLKENKKKYVKLYKLELEKTIDKKYKSLGIEKKIKEIKILKEKINNIELNEKNSPQDRKKTDKEQKDNRKARDRFMMPDQDQDI